MPALQAGANRRVGAPTPRRTRKRPSLDNVPPRHTPLSQSPVFGRLRRADEPLVRSQHQAARRTRRAANRLPEEHQLKRFPLLTRYTRGQRQTIIREQSRRLGRLATDRGYVSDYVAELRAAKRQGADPHRVPTPGARILADSTSEDRRQIVLLNRLLRSEQQHRVRAGARMGMSRSQLAGAVARPGGTSSRHTKIAGFDVSAAASDLNRRAFPEGNPGLRILKAPIELARATVEDPGAVAGSSLRTAKESIAGLPEGLAMLATHPRKAVREMARDYSRRYGPLLDDPRKFREQVKSDYGLTPFALDVGGVSAASGRAAAILARTGTAGRAAEALSRARAFPGAPLAGRVVGAAHRAATEERPALRFSAGETGVRPQRTSRNLFVAMGQRGLDRSRRKAFERRLERAGLKPGEAGALERAPGELAGRVQALRPGAREVLPISRLDVRETPLLRSLTGITERRHGQRKSFNRMRLLGHQADVEKAARRAIKGLDGKEKLGLRYAMELGLSPERMDASLAALRTLRSDIERNRRVEGAVSAFEPDNLPEIDAILADPQGHITPRVRQAANVIRDEIQAPEVARDPALPPERAARRRLEPLRQLLGVEKRGNIEEFNARLDGIAAKLQDKGVPVTAQGLRDRFAGIGDLPPEQRLAVANELERATRKDAKRAERAVDTAVRRAAVARERVRTLERRGIPQTTPEVRSARQELARTQRDVARMRGEIKATLREAPKIPGVTHGRDFRLRDLRAQVAAGEQRVRELRSHVRDLEREAPRVPETHRQRIRDAEHDVVRKRAERDDARIERDMAKRVRKSIKAKPGRYENFDDFARRMDAAIEQAGLEAPAYFESTGEFRPRFSVKAIGTGIRGAANDRRYTGERFWMGRQSSDPEVIVHALLRNAKRRFSWRFTVETVRQSAFEWSRGVAKGGMTIDELRREFDRRHIDPDSVELVNVRTLETRELEAEGFGRGDVTGEPVDTEPGIPSEDMADAHTALGDARGGQAKSLIAQTLREGRDLTPDEVKGQAMNRYLVLPARDFEELSAAMRPSGLVGRAIDIVWKQKPARIMLGLANVPWLAFQVISNGFVSGLGHTVNPFDYVAAQRWWRTLSPEEKLAIEPELGITHHHHAIGQDETHLGAATNNRFVYAWRAFKSTPVMRAAHRVNPLDAMFRADEAQNNFFRRTVFYTDAKRAAYARMGRTWDLLTRSHDSLMGALPVRRNRSLEQIQEDVRRVAIGKGPQFEEHAQHVRDFLGDYLSFTSRERATLSRSAMFYGYLRFSLRFALWTMPVQHPIMAAILSDMGRMGAQEIKRLLGVPSNFDVPTNMLANYYIGGPKSPLRVMPLGRANPFLNSLTQLQQPQQIAGLFSPLFQAEVDQMFHQSTFTGRQWVFSNQPIVDATQQPSNYYGSFLSQFVPTSPRGRILMESLATLAFPYRLAENIGIPGVRQPLVGPQYADSTLLSPRPRTYKDPETMKSIRAQRQRELAVPFARRLAQQTLPFGVAQPTVNREILQRELEKRQAMEETKGRKGKPKKRRKAKKKTSYSYGGAGGTDYGSRYGGSSSGSTNYSSRYGGGG